MNVFFVLTCKESLINTKYIGMPLRHLSNEEPSTNLYKEKVLELEDKVFEIEQTLHNTIKFKEIFTQLAEILNIEVKSIPKLDKLKRGFGVLKDFKKSNTSSISQINFEDQNENHTVFDLSQLLNVRNSEKTGNPFHQKNNQSSNSDLKNVKKSNVASLDQLERNEAKNNNARYMNAENLRSNELKKKIQLTRILSRIQSKDVLFLLEKIKKMESQFAIFKFLSKQEDHKISELNISYLVRKIESQLPKNSKITSESIRSKVAPQSIKKLPIDKNMNTPNALNPSISQPQETPSLLPSFSSFDSVTVFYKKLKTALTNIPPLSSSYEIKIILTKYQKTMLAEYVQTNLQIITQRINNLTQIKSFKNKEKNQISKIANDFVYDQKIVDSLNDNFNKIEDMQIDQVFKVLEGEGEGSKNTFIDEQVACKCFFYDQRFKFSLRPIDDQHTRMITAALK